MTTIGNPSASAADRRKERSSYSEKLMGQDMVSMDGTPSCARTRCVRHLSSHTDMHWALLKTGNPQTSRLAARRTSLSQNRTKSASPRARSAATRSPMGIRRSALVTRSRVTSSSSAAADSMRPGSENFSPRRYAFDTNTPLMPRSSQR